MPTIKQILKKNEWWSSKWKSQHFAIRITIEEFGVTRNFWYSGLTSFGFKQPQQTIESLVYKQPKRIEKLTCIIFRHYQKNHVGDNIIIRIFPVRFSNTWVNELCYIHHTFEEGVYRFDQKDLEDLTFKHKLQIL